MVENLVEKAEQRRRTWPIIAGVAALVAVLTAVQVLLPQLRYPSPIPSNILIFALVNEPYPPRPPHPPGLSESVQDLSGSPA